ncbi:aspartokinase [Helicobacter mustelae]|uniref:aspartate kinase n=1 Tax=Helicobacter mustelae TaxID=217 RepID=UPI000DFAD7F6|nr:aspartate kinase [Helicobacter mustelae]STP12047.1 aspartokinase [Helicobacter mustelae]
MLIVQKYGGTSMGDCDRIWNVANRVAQTKRAGHSVAVVVSAMSGVTDTLVGYTKYFGESPNPRESDMVLSSGERITSALLAIALSSMGFKAISLSGRRARVFTDDIHTKARITHIDPREIRHFLKEDYIVVVAGFQGITKQGEVTTLGRGGSDLSAVAIAGALHADLCEIYTDVDGIYTTDPRVESRAKKIDKISYDEMLELASMGAKVLFNRSVELAKKWNIPLITRSSFGDDEGTLITDEENIMEKAIVSGVALDKNQARVSMGDVSDRPGIAAEIFGTLAQANINVDMIVQTIGRDGKTDLDFTIPESEVKEAREALKRFGGVDVDCEIAKVSIVGVGMKSHSGVASTAFHALAKENINIMMISTSEIKVSMVIALKYAELAVRALHGAYELDA